MWDKFFNWLLLWWLFPIMYLLAFYDVKRRMGSLKYQAKKGKPGQMRNCVKSWFGVKIKVK